MNRYFLRTIFAGAAIILSAIPGYSGSVNNENSVPDSLSLQQVIKEVVANHPSVKEAEEAVKTAGANLGLAKSGYYPDADITAGYSNIGPVTKLTIPDMGTFQLFPADNYSASLNLKENIYDFGRTRQNVRIENGNKAISEQTLESVRQNLSLAAVNVFYSIVYLQAAIKIKDEQIATLNEHLSYVEKLRSTGSATEYQVLSTRVRISAIESQRVDLEAALTSQQALMHSLIGDPGNQIIPVKNELSATAPGTNPDSLTSYAFRNRNEMILNRERASIAGMRYDLAKIQERPVLNFQASAGAKNGYIPDLYKLRPDYVLGFGLRIPISDHLKNKNRLLQAQSAINSLSFESENIKRNISTEILDARSAMYSASTKMSQYQLQLAQAEKANSLAETSFRAGTITNLDLLDANTAVSESRLMLLRSRVDYLLSIYRLRAATGEKIY
jgi:outer membrane protein TolC